VTGQVAQGAPGAPVAAGGGRFGHAEVFASIAALSFFAARFLPLLSIPYTCPLRGMTGIPCATCGMTHAFVFLAHGRVADALAASPLGAAIAASAWLLALADAVRVALGAPLPSVPRRLARAAVAAGVLALLANWGFLVLREVRP
jgi:Protein of unknown function (DUF2752)